MSRKNRIIGKAVAAAKTAVAANSSRRSLADNANAILKAADRETKARKPWLQKRKQR